MFGDPEGSPYDSGDAKGSPYDSGDPKGSPYFTTSSPFIWRQRSS
jgi:hypothetical protein